MAHMTPQAKQREQLKGYTQAVQEMSALIKRESSGWVTPTTIAMEKIESKMREKVLRLVEGQDDA